MLRRYCVLYGALLWILYVLTYVRFVRNVGRSFDAEPPGSSLEITPVTPALTRRPALSRLVTAPAELITSPPPSDPMMTSIPLRLVVFTTMKPCEGKLVHAQYNSVMSWRRLPLRPPPIVVIFGGQDDVARIANRTGALHVPRGDCIDPHSGTALLGKMIQHVTLNYPNADMYGFLNADIILPRFSADAFRLVSTLFTQFFLVGHRFSVGVEGDLPFHDSQWDVMYVQKAFRSGTAAKDRPDAEDYFFWSRGFLKGEAVPDFHIGRPAYDNWFVHHAIHTDQPVIDGTDLLLPLHQNHDYSHLKTNNSVRYWGSVEQQRNYDLALQHGGWQHGLVEFTPFRISPKRCGLRGLLEEAAKKSPLLVSSPPCQVYFRREWKPLQEEWSLADVHDMYGKYVRPGQTGTYRAALQEPPQ